MSRTRLHWPAPGDEGRLAVAACGIIAARLATRLEDVTCRLCHRRLRAAAPPAPPRLPADWLERLRADLGRTWRASPEGLPFLRPDTWAAYRSGAPRGSALGDWYSELERWADVRIWGDSRRPKVARRAPSKHRWPDVEAALGTYAQSLEDGYPVQTIAPVKGAAIQAARGRGDGTPAIRAAEDRVSVEAALRRGWELEALPWPAYLGVVLGAVVGSARVVARNGRLEREATPVPDGSLAARWGLEEREVGPLVRRARGAAAVELAARGLIPDPPPGSRRRSMVEARRAEIAARREGA